MIAWSRIDSRLIHGQVIEAWVPHLGVARVVVADDDAAKDPLARVAYDMAMPAEGEVVLSAIDALDFAALAGDDVRTLVIFRDVKSAVDARAHGLPDGMLNLGHGHAGPGRVSISRSVFLDDRDARELATLSNGGMDVRVQAVPTDAPARYPG